MKTTLLFLFLFILAGCTTDKKKATDSQPNESDTKALLTESQKAGGWKLLFDGQTMTGWRTFKNLENNSWEVFDGTLHCKSFDDADKRSDLLTVEQFENFELAFEWKISPQGNSGVMFRVTEEYDQPFFTGPEYQILDDDGYPGEVKEVNYTGGNYDMHAPVNKKLNPVGEWNSSRIVANGNQIEHWLNGVKVVEYEIGSDDWTKRKNESKWSDVVGYGIPTKGHIDLQDHGNEVWLMNIMIREL